MTLENFRTQKIIWDRANKKIFETIEANSGDSNGRKLVVQIINQEMTESLSGTTLSLGWKSRNGAKGLDTFNLVDASKGVFEIYYTTEMLSNIGNLEASLILIDSTSRIESSTFTISVRPSTVDDEAVESENSFTALTEALVKVNDFNARLAQTVTKGEVDNKIAQIVSASPKGTYATLSALQTAFPNGTTGIFVVTADGKWYYWNSSEWTAGGTYQSTGIAPESINYGELSSDVISGTHNQLILGDFEIGTLDSSSGLPGARLTTRIRQINFMTTKQSFIQFANDGVADYSLFFYNKETHQRLDSTPWTNQTYFKIPYEDCFTKIIMKKRDGTEITTDEILALTSKIKVYELREVNIEQQLEGINLGEFISENTITPSKTTFLSTGGSEKRVNFFNKDDIITGGYYNSNGVLTPSSASSSGLIPVIEGDVLRLKPMVGGGYHFTFWDDNEQFLEGEYLSLSAGVIKTINVTNPNAKFFRTAFRNEELDDFMVVKNIQYPNRYYPYSELDYDLIIGGKLANSIKELVSNDVSTKLNGLKWGVIGDSISTVGYKGGEYPQKISGKNNMTTQNLAVPGSLIAKSNKSGHATTHMCQKVLELDQDCDLVTVAGGTNDQRFNLPLGTFGDTSIETFYGAMHELCKNLINRFPETPKAIFTPIKMRGANVSLKTYVEVIKEVAAYYSIPVCDNFNEADLQPDIETINNTYFSASDGVHPNTRGHDILARKVENFLKNLV